MLLVFRNISVLALSDVKTNSARNYSDGAIETFFVSQVSTQTSRSVVVVARARTKNKQNEVRYTNPQLSKVRVASQSAVLGNVTRATPTGIRRKPTHRFAAYSESVQRLIEKRRKEQLRASAEVCTNLQGWGRYF